MAGSDKGKLNNLIIEFFEQMLSSCPSTMKPLTTDFKRAKYEGLTERNSKDHHLQLLHLSAAATDAPTERKCEITLIHAHATKGKAT